MKTLTHRAIETNAVEPRHWQRIRIREVGDHHIKTPLEVAHGGVGITQVHGHSWVSETVVIETSQLGLLPGQANDHRVQLHHVDPFHAGPAQDFSQCQAVTRS